MKKIIAILATMLLTSNLYGDNCEGTNIDLNSKVSLKDQISNLIKNGSSGLGCPMGNMPGGMAADKNIEALSIYLANGLEGERPEAFKNCIACHGEDGEGHNGMSSDISSLNKDKSKKTAKKYNELANKAINNDDVVNFVKNNTLSCEMGYGIGCRDLGLIYIKGIGVDKDIKNGLSFWKKGCYELKNGDSCLALSNAYNKDTLVKKDFKKSFELLEKSCEYNFENACYSLALVYYNGIEPIKEDKDKATKFLKKSCDLGHKKGCKDLDRIEFSKQFTLEQIKVLNRAFEDVKLPK